MNLKSQISNLKYLLLFALFFSFGFFAGMQYAQRKIAQRPTFDKDGFVKSVGKIITGKVLEVKKDSLVLTKNNKNFVVKIEPAAKITITKLALVGATPRAASPGAVFLPPPEITRQASLSDIRVGDQVTISVTETPDGKLLGKVVSVERR